MFRLFRNKKGQGLVEYALIVAGVALICAAAISVFGHKVNDMIAAVATVLPGANSEDNGPIVSNGLIETAQDEDGNIGLDLQSIRTGGPRLGNNVLGDGAGEGFGGLIVHGHDHDH